MNRIKIKQLNLKKVGSKKSLYILKVFLIDMIKNLSF